MMNLPFIHQMNFLQWKRKQMKFLQDIAKDIMTKIFCQVFTFSIQIKKEDLVAAGLLRNVSNFITYSFLYLLM